MEIKQIRLNTARPGIPARFLVTLDGREVGLLEKFANTKTEIHPWKAFAGIGEHSRYIGSFYDASSLLPGRRLALEALLKEVA